MPKPYTTERRHVGRGYACSLQREETATLHMLCILSVASPRSICADVDVYGPVLPTLDWHIAVRHDQEENTNALEVFAVSALHTEPACGFRLKQVDDDFVCALIDGALRTGNLAIQIGMRDDGGKHVRFDARVPATSLLIAGPSEHIQATIYARWRHRN